MAKTGVQWNFQDKNQRVSRVNSEFLRNSISQHMCQDGSVNLPSQEVDAIIRNLSRKEKKISKMWWALGFAAIFSVALFALTFASALSANEASKESHVSDSTLQDLDGQAVKTDAVKSYLALWSLPLLSSDALAALRYVTLSHNSGRQMTYEIGSASTFADQAELYSVDGSKIEIDMSERKAVVTTHGEEYIIDESHTTADHPAWVFGEQVSDLAIAHSDSMGHPTFVIADGDLTYDNRPEIPHDIPEDATTTIETVHQHQCIDQCLTTCVRNIFHDETYNGCQCFRDCATQNEGGCEADYIDAFLSGLDEEDVCNHRDRKALAGYGCCSTNVIDLIGGADNNDCTVGTYQDCRREGWWWRKKTVCKTRHPLMNGNDLSDKCCFNHDFDLKNCGGDCKCKGDADWALVGCSFFKCWPWQVNCIITATEIQVIMATRPNQWARC